MPQTAPGYNGTIVRFIRAQLKAIVGKDWGLPAWRGRYLPAGFAAGDMAPAAQPAGAGAALVGVLGDEFVQREPGANLAAMTQRPDWLAAGRIRPHIPARYAPADTPRALAALAARQVTGKVIIKP